MHFRKGLQHGMLAGSTENDVETKWPVTAGRTAAQRWPPIGISLLAHGQFIFY